KASAALKAKELAEAQASAALKAKELAEAQASAALKAKEKAESLIEANRKSTITCVKGTSVRKITAVKPVCPSGYKKK
ncbi:MAG: hypothetical protein ACO29Z_06285, partial [Crocinitomicaceae bacterium]